MEHVLVCESESSRCARLMWYRYSNAVGRKAALVDRGSVCAGRVPSRSRQSHGGRGQAAQQACDLRAGWTSSRRGQRRLPSTHLRITDWDAGTGAEVSVWLRTVLYADCHGLENDALHELAVVCACASQAGVPAFVGRCLGNVNEGTPMTKIKAFCTMVSLASCARELPMRP